MNIFSFFSSETTRIISNILNVNMFLLKHLQKHITHLKNYTCINRITDIYFKYYGIIRTCGVSIFAVFMGGPRSPRNLHPCWKQILKKAFLTETENLRIHEISSPQISKKPAIRKNWPQWFKWFHRNIRIKQ